MALEVVDEFETVQFQIGYRQRFAAAQPLQTTAEARFDTAAVERLG